MEETVPPNKKCPFWHADCIQIPCKFRNNHCYYDIHILFSFFNQIDILSIYRCVEVFALNMGMIIPLCGEIGTGKIPPSSLKAHYIFPIHGLAVGVKINFPPSRLRRSGGNFIFTPPAKPFVEKILCAFGDSGGILFFPSRGFATRGEKSRPYFSTQRDWHIPP